MDTKYHEQSRIVKTLKRKQGKQEDDCFLQLCKILTNPQTGRNNMKTLGELGEEYKHLAFDKMSVPIIWKEVGVIFSDFEHEITEKMGQNTKWMQIFNLESTEGKIPLNLKQRKFLARITQRWIDSLPLFVEQAQKGPYAFDPKLKSVKRASFLQSVANPKLRIDRSRFHHFLKSMELVPPTDSSDDIPPFDASFYKWLLSLLSWIEKVFLVQFFSPRDPFLGVTEAQCAYLQKMNQKTNVSFPQIRTHLQELIRNILTKQLLAHPSLEGKIHPFAPLQEQLKQYCDSKEAILEGMTPVCNAHYELPTCVWEEGILPESLAVKLAKARVEAQNRRWTRGRRDLLRTGNLFQ